MQQQKNMSLKNESVTILGAGIGGLTAAICLLQRGARVTIFDQAKKIEGFGAVSYTHLTLPTIYSV